jgi:predicted AlkP superfamily pyrophosphatase or phosphodiesterase
VILVSVDGLAGFYLDDPAADLPTLRRLAAKGARAEGLVCSFPTVTWPNHTTLVTGVTPTRHGVIGNGYIDRKSGQRVALIPDPLFDKDQIVKTPTVYDAAHRAGLDTAAIIWPATRNARTLNWTVPDMFEADSWERFGTRHWLAELRRQHIPVDQYGQWVKESSGGVQRDWLYARMAAQLLKTHAPNLLLIHFVEPDHVQHRVGPRTPDAYWSASFADDRIRDLVEAVEASPKKDKTTIFVCSDHGFFPIDKEIRVNLLLKQLGLLTVEGSKITKRSAYAIAEGGACQIAILNPAVSTETRKKLSDELAKLEGVDRVIGADEFATVGQPTPQQDPNAPDIWVAAKSGYSFGDGFSGEEVVTARSTRGGTHGYLPDQPDMLGTFVAAGPAIRPRTRLGKISNLDVAPTIARILRIDLPNTDGKPLDEIIAPAR